MVISSAIMSSWCQNLTARIGQFDRNAVQVDHKKNVTVITGELMKKWYV